MNPSTTLRASPEDAPLNEARSLSGAEGEGEREREADILFPDRSITINGEAVTVKEFSYLEGLKAAAIAQPLLADLLLLIQSEDALGLTELDRIIGQNADAWTELLGLSIGQTADWVAGLSDKDGTRLSMMFWEINGPFLVRRVAFAKQFGQIVLQPPAEN